MGRDALLLDECELSSTTIPEDSEKWPPVMNDVCRIDVETVVVRVDALPCVLACMNQSWPIDLKPASSTRLTRSVIVHHSVPWQHTGLT